MTPNISTYTDNQGREFHYSLINNQSRKLVIHFTAFFGDWGDRKEYKKYYKGYFHRYRMFADQSAYNFLFLCDQFGVTENGTYYTGKAGDFFVERATQDIIDKVMADLDIRWSNVITVGSSMGATSALKYGLKNNAKAIIAIAPHIDLDICAKMQGREQHVAWICPDGDTQAAHNYPYTRQIQALLRNLRVKPPRLFIHSCEDDHGVYHEQVIPFNRLYAEKGGEVVFFSRPDGGHGGDACGKEVLLDVLGKFYADKPVNPRQYSGFRYLPENLRSPLPFAKHYVKKLLVRAGLRQPL
jgi:hypothetical protein